MNEQELTDLLARLGAPNPAGWARSQIREGMPQLVRFVFLRQAWKLIVASGDTKWIEQQLQVSAHEPLGAIASALTRLLAQDVQKEDLTTVVKVMQCRLLFSLCCC